MEFTGEDIIKLGGLSNDKFYALRVARYVLRGAWGELRGSCCALRVTGLALRGYIVD